MGEHQPSSCSLKDYTVKIVDCSITIPRLLISEALLIAREHAQLNSRKNRQRALTIRIWLTEHPISGKLLHFGPIVFVLYLDVHLNASLLMFMNIRFQNNISIQFWYFIKIGGQSTALHLRTFQHRNHPNFLESKFWWTRFAKAYRNTGNSFQIQNSAKL